MNDPAVHITTVVPMYMQQFRIGFNFNADLNLEVQVNADPDPGFVDQNLKKIIYIIIYIKKYIIFLLFKNCNILKGSFCPPGSGSGSCRPKIKTDPCGSGSTVLQYLSVPMVMQGRCGMKTISRAGGRRTTPRYTGHRPDRIRNREDFPHPLGPDMSTC